MKRIEVWDLSSQKRLRQLAIAKQGSEAPPPETRSAKSGASKTPAVASSEWKAIVWLSPNGRYVCGVTNSPTGDRVVVWDLDGDAVGQPVGIVQGLPIAAFSPDNQLVAFVSRSKKVVLWNVATNRLDKEIELPLEPSGAVGFGPGGTLGIACAQSTEKRVSGSPGPQTLVIWDLAHHREMKRTGTIPGVPNSISFSPEGASVAISHGVAGNILVFNLADRKSAVPLNHGAMTRTLTWTDDGQHLLTGGLGSLKTWEFADESAASDLRLEVEQETSFGVPFALSPNGRFIAIQSRGMPNVELYDSMARKFVRRFPRDASDHKLPPHLWFSPDGKQLVVLTHQSVVIWDVDTATQRVRMDANRSQLQGFTSVGFRADGSVLVGGIANLMPAVFEAANGKEIWRGQGAGLAALVSLDGRFATIFASVLGRTQQSVSLVDLSTGKERSQLPGPPNGAVQTTLREFSPNGRWLLALHFGRSAATDHQEVTSSFGSAGPGYQGSGIAQQPWTADVLDVESGKRHMQIDGASNPIARVFSRDGRYLAVGMANGAIRFWDTQVREELFDWHPFGDHADESFLPQYLAFDADDANLVVPNPVSPAFRMLNLPRVNEQLGTAALNW
jgi:WD40 repeat protein